MSEGVSDARKEAAMPVHLQPHYMWCAFMKSPTEQCDCDAMRRIPPAGAEVSDAETFWREAETEVMHYRGGGSTIGSLGDWLVRAIESRRFVHQSAGRAPSDAALWAAFCKGLVHGELNILEQDTSKPHSITGTPSWEKYQDAVKANAAVRDRSPAQDGAK